MGNGRRIAEEEVKAARVRLAELEAVLAVCVERRDQGAPFLTGEPQTAQKEVGANG